MSNQDFWTLVKTSFTNCCNCCTTREIDHDRLTPSEGSPYSTFPRAFDNPVLDNESPDNFVIDVLDTPDTHWRPQVRLRFQENDLMNANLGDFGELEYSAPQDDEAQIDSKSSGRESGYGRSIEESLDSSSESEYSVSITQSNSKATYKLVVQDRRRCWCVFRRQLEFVALQEHIREKVGIIGKDLPVGIKADVEELQNFIKKISSDAKILQLQKVREFLHLDRYKSDSSMESGDSAQIISQQPKPMVLLNPKDLLRDTKTPLSRSSGKKLSNEGNEKSDKEPVTKLPTVPLGCEVKKMTPADFDFLSVIGKGSFGTVMLARKREDGKVYAVKILNKKMILRKNETAHVMSERSVLTLGLRHPYIVQLHFAFTTPTKIFFVLDYVNGGELFYHLQKERIFTEKRAKFYASEICCALTYMHSKGIVYRDLKPENILLDRKGHVILTDFGLCKEGIDSSSSRTSTFCGTPEYLAPEVILKKPYTRSVDWWTYGAVFYEMLYGLPPFYYKNTTQMYNAIIHKPLKLKETISAGARDILNLLLQKSPEKRLGSGPRDGYEVKSHFFFIAVDWNLIETRGIPPPFIPTVANDEDTSNIDPIFLKESFVFPSSHSNQASPSLIENKAFRGFSYVSPIQEECGR